MRHHPEYGCIAVLAEAEPSSSLGLVGCCDLGTDGHPRCRLPQHVYQCRHGRQCSCVHGEVQAAPTVFRMSSSLQGYGADGAG